MVDDAPLSTRHDWLEQVAARLLWLHPDWPEHQAVDIARAMGKSPAAALPPFEAARRQKGSPAGAPDGLPEAAGTHLLNGADVPAAPASVSPADVLVATATGAAVGFATGLASGALSSMTGALIGAVSGGMAVARTAERDTSPASEAAP